MSDLASDIRRALIEDLRPAVDPAAFAEDQLGLKLDDWQQEFLDSASRRRLLNCARQSGKSTLAAVLALYRALYYPDSLVLCVAPALRQSQELFAKVSGFYRMLDNPSPALGDRKLALELANGSRILTMPGSEKTIRGFSGVSLLLADEAARIPDELHFSIRPMLAVSGGTLVLLSTPFGKSGTFWEEWSKGIGWDRYHVTAEQVDRIKPSFLAQERRTMPEAWFLQEYMAEFTEAEDAVFRGEDIDALLSDDVELLVVPD